MRVLAAALVLIVAVPAAAQNDPATPSQQRRVVIDFDADVIEADPKVPAVEVRTADKPRRFKSLVQPRASFARAVLQSGAQL